MKLLSSILVVLAWLILCNGRVSAFLSADPMGHDGSMDLYDYCNGDPVNGLDPDGRCIEGFESGESGSISANAPNSAAFSIGLTAGSIYQGITTANYQQAAAASLDGMTTLDGVAPWSAPFTLNNSNDPSTIASERLGTLGLAGVAGMALEAPVVYGAGMDAIAASPTLSSLYVGSTNLAYSPITQSLAAGFGGYTYLSSGAAAEGGTASLSRWTFSADTPSSVIDQATADAMATFDRNGTQVIFSNSDSNVGRIGFARYDTNTVTLYPGHDVTTLMEEAHHIQTAADLGLLGNPVESASEAAYNSRLLEEAWEQHAAANGIVPKPGG